MSIPMEYALWEIIHVQAIQVMEQVRALHAILLMTTISTIVIPSLLTGVKLLVIHVQQFTQMALVKPAGGQQRPMALSALDRYI
jgi:hypothetical protein